MIRSSMFWLCGFFVVTSLSCGDQVVVRETQAACGNGV